MLNIIKKKEVVWNDVKTWVNELFSMHGKELTKENLNELKAILTEHKLKKYYNFFTNEKKEIVITFPLGEVKVRLSYDTLEVTIEEPTKRNIYELRTNHLELEQINNQPKISLDVEKPNSEESLTMNFAESEGTPTDVFNELADFSEVSFPV